MPQCSNCQFQNMPGVTHCGRCGTSLMLRTAVIDVHPPRATRWAKLWRKTFTARLVRSVRASSKAVERQWGVPPNMKLPPLGVLCRLLVPGWPQMFDGRPTLGRGLLLGYGVCLLAAAVCFGSTFSSVLLGMAFACHGVSVYDVARRSSPSVGDRLFRMLLGCGLLAAGIYLPAYSLATSYVNPIVIQADRSPLRAGDVLLVNVTTYVRSAPRGGDVVQYQMREAQVMGQTIGGADAVFVFRGPRIDRVLAGPGQVVVWDGERLTVDGQRSTVLPPIVEELTRQPNGLILVTGQTGMGKTTTLNYMIDCINRQRRAKIVTIEDPIEFVHENQRSIVVQQEVMTDVRSFREALVHVLRQDPDVIVIGEMRNLETIETALTAAETGHLVLATLHTPDAVQTVQRIYSVFPAEQQNSIVTQIANSLRAIIAQKLLPLASGQG